MANAKMFVKYLNFLYYYVSITLVEHCVQCRCFDGFACYSIKHKVCKGNKAKQNFK